MRNVSSDSYLLASGISAFALLCVIMLHFVVSIPPSLWTRNYEDDKDLLTEYHGPQDIAPPNLPFPLTQLPDDVLTQIIHPSTGLSTKDLWALLSTSKSMHALKTRLSITSLFYYIVAAPHLAVRPKDGVTRFAQNLYKCARLSEAASDAILKYSTFISEENHLPIKPGDFMVACARGMMELASTGFISDAAEIPLSFQIGLVYKSMRKIDDMIAFDSLMSLLNFKSLAVRKTLEHEFFCRSMLLAIKRKESPASIIHQYFPPHPVNQTRASACLVWMHASRDVSMPALEGYSVDIFLSLRQIEKLKQQEISQYKVLLNEFRRFADHSDTEPSQSSILSFIDRGLFLNTLSSLDVGDDSDDFDFVTSYLNSARHCKVIKAILKAGYKVDPDSMAGWNVLTWSRRLYGRDVVRWFLEHGVDVNSYDDVSWETELHKLTHIDVDESAEYVELLIEYGGDMLSKNRVGVTPLILLATSTRPLELFKLCIVRGRVDIRKYPGLLFDLIFRRAPLPVIEYLVMEQGMNVIGVTDPQGRSPSQMARYQGHRDLAQWLDWYESEKLLSNP